MIGARLTMGIFNSDSKIQEKQFSQQMQATSEANDGNLATQMNNFDNIVHEPQVSAMFLESSDKLFRMRFIPKLNSDGEMVFVGGRPEGDWVKDYADYNEPIGDEQRCFVKDEQKMKFIDMSLGFLVEAKGFRDTHQGKKENGKLREAEMVNTFNRVEGLRKSILVGSRVSGDSGKLAKSQIIDSSARIFRESVAPKKKPFLGGLFG